MQGPLWPREIREIVTTKFMKVNTLYIYMVCDREIQAFISTSSII